MAKIFFHFGHPAHYHLFVNSIHALSQKHRIWVSYNDKDVLGHLINGALPVEQVIRLKSLNRVNNGIGLKVQFAQKNWGLLKALIKVKPDIILGTQVIISLMGRLTKTPNIIVNEDDFDVIAKTANLGYPYADAILCPQVCRTGDFADKSVTYSGYHELAYLHPKYFTPEKLSIQDRINLKNSFFLLRFAQLTAHHDTGKTGISAEIARRIISRLEKHGDVYITSERDLEPEFEKYRIAINPVDIHHALYYADMYIGDSQTMAAEAAVLGTPSIRFNDFVGRIGYLEELEHTYGLTYGIKTAEPEKLFQKIDEFLETPNLKDEWQKRRQKMLKEKIDVTAFMVWFVEHYPESVRIMREEPEYQEKFR